MIRRLGSDYAGQRQAVSVLSGDSVSLLSCFFYMVLQMAVAVWNRCPSHMTTGEYSMYLEDKPRDIPAHLQPDFPVDHSRLPHLIFEREQRERALRICPSLTLDALCLTAEIKHADQFWRQVLLSKLDALFFLERQKDYVEDDDHKKRVEQLNDAKRAAGYPVHSAR